MMLSFIIGHHRVDVYYHVNPYSHHRNRGCNICRISAEVSNACCVYPNNPYRNGKAITGIGFDTYLCGQAHSVWSAAIKDGEISVMMCWSSSGKLFGKLTHWGRATHIYVITLTIIASGNGLSPGRRHAIIWNNAEILSIGLLGTNFSEI